MKFKEVKTYTRDSTVSTEGFAWDNGCLIESVGKSIELKALSLNKSGSKWETEFSFDLNYDDLGEGICVTDDKIIQLTQFGPAWIYSRETRKFLTLWEHNIHETWGIAYRPQKRELIISAPFEDNLFFFDSDTFKMKYVKCIRSDRDHTLLFNELEYAKGYLYANLHRPGNRFDVARIDLESNVVIDIIDMSEVSQEVVPAGGEDYIREASGIAYDHVNDHFYVTGKDWGKIFQVEEVE